jgi:hypothetical protein
MCEQLSTKVADWLAKEGYVLEYLMAVDRSGSSVKARGTSADPIKPRWQYLSKRVSQKSAPKGHRPTAWGFNPRKEVPQGPSSPEGAQAGPGPVSWLPAPLRGFWRGGRLTWG